MLGRGCEKSNRKLQGEVLGVRPNPVQQNAQKSGDVVFLGSSNFDDAYLLRRVFGYLDILYVFK